MTDAAASKPPPRLCGLRAVSFFRWVDGEKRYVCQHHEAQARGVAKTLGVGIHFEVPEDLDQTCTQHVTMR